MSTWIVPSFLFTVIYVFLIIFFLQSPDMQWMGAYPQFMYNSIYFFIGYAIFGFACSISSSKSYCNRISYSGSMYHGFMIGLIAVCTVLAIVFIPALSSPFNELIGESWKSDLATYTFFLFLNITILTIIYTHQSAMENCRLSSSEVEKELTKMDAYLDTPEEEDSGTTIEVKD